MRQHDREMSATLFLADDMNIAALWMMEGETDRVFLPVDAIVHYASHHDTRHILLCHTHPSSNPQPSRQDIIATRSLCARLRRNGMHLLDHIILSQHHYFSFRAGNLL